MRSMLQYLQGTLLVLSSLVDCKLLSHTPSKVQHRDLQGETFIKLECSRKNYTNMGFCSNSGWKFHKCIQVFFLYFPFFKVQFSLTNHFQSLTKELILMMPLGIIHSLPIYLLVFFSESKMVSMLKYILTFRLMHINFLSPMSLLHLTNASYNNLPKYKFNLTYHLYMLLEIYSKFLWPDKLDCNFLFEHILDYI